MEERRAALLALLAGGLIVAAAPVAACTPAPDGTTVHSPRYVLSFKGSDMEVGKHFSLDIAVCAKDKHPAPESVKVDARMPEHRHGMNYAPAIKPTGSGRWRAEGLMFHMPGKWELVFEVRAAGKTDVLRSSLVLSEVLVFSESEKAKILAHGPWPPKRAPDPGNRVSGKAEAIALGEKLFFEPRLSGTGSVLCATCHVPFRDFQDARPVGVGLEPLERNTPSLINVRFNRWFGWDGAQDSLWAQSLRPLLDEREMRATPAHVAATIRKLFATEYEDAFGAPSGKDEDILVNVGKALAAYQETLVSPRSAFDAFRDALEKDDLEAMRRYPLAAQRGLRIFVGPGNCSVCHFGPAFTNGEFADIGVGFFIKNKAAVDSGRAIGIKRLKESPFNLLGAFNDHATKANAVATRHVEPQHRNFGEWRVPGLRGVARTAPYMHNGSLATLRDVVKHYSELNEERLHADGERILKPLKLSAEEMEHLLAFLKTL